MESAWDWICRTPKRGRTGGRLEKKGTRQGRLGSWIVGTRLHASWCGDTDLQLPRLRIFAVLSRFWYRTVIQFVTQLTREAVARAGKCAVATAVSSDTTYAYANTFAPHGFTSQSCDSCNAPAPTPLARLAPSRSPGSLLRRRVSDCPARKDFAGSPALQIPD